MGPTEAKTTGGRTEPVEEEGLGNRRNSETINPGLEIQISKAGGWIGHHYSLSSSTNNPTGKDIGTGSYTWSDMAVGIDSRTDMSSGCGSVSAVGLRLLIHGGFSKGLGGFSSSSLSQLVKGDLH